MISRSSLLLGLPAVARAGDTACWFETSAALAPDINPLLAGALGTDLWSRWRVRLDIAHGRLVLSPK